ncbi:MAG: hypothetical protein ONB44_01560 [candidate division KSB1 bacterium]|nr:hypothetical protein [candidate division KSB1 bacterium]MDZ7300807.1 hypothetical protein [candidate division KSB1 bacterium]MDZ7309922.1 hypothetical protein [candidate division KSB1 bacterium]
MRARGVEVDRLGLAGNAPALVVPPTTQAIFFSKIKRLLFLAWTIYV